MTVPTSEPPTSRFQTENAAPTPPVEYDVGSNTIRPLMVLTNVWCSSGTLMSDGTLVQTGGWADGYRRVTTYKSCGTCDWKEIPNGLNQQRWYATNHLLPDGRQIIIDAKNQVVRTYPTMPGGQPRNYPSTGSAVLLPLWIKQGVVEAVEVLVCGGTPKGAFANANNGRFDGALDSCGRIRISDNDPQWVMETMPLARVMGDMLLLPNGHVLIINGASAGVAGWELGRNPVLSPVTYRPDNQIGPRFEVQNPSTKPRVYDSTAVLLRDGRVLVGGSNPHDKYVFANALYPTELSLEAFSPSYLDSSSSPLRPRIISPKTKTKIRYGKLVAVTFAVSGPVDPNLVTVTMVSPSFNTLVFYESKDVGSG
ncbi:hypothetical protein L1987_66604 [Smallanthus sonchifolius]|uniref:Uncharacterized protein n=1 Tax=Smallanthus sonchifolius TaxID=185202 RepID=A0ACB9BXX7_9ASTR|nr:hypothetical protein L1987_66604 [Smallanthus sonchifolius]